MQQTQKSPPEGDKRTDNHEIPNVTSHPNHTEIRENKTEMQQATLEVIPRRGQSDDELTELMQNLSISNTPELENISITPQTQDPLKTTHYQSLRISSTQIPPPKFSRPWTFLVAQVVWIESMRKRKRESYIAQARQAAFSRLRQPKSVPQQEIEAQATQSIF